jgi:hypothetical protein
MSVARNSRIRKALAPAGYRTKSAPLIRIAIRHAAFDAIVATMPLGSVGYEAKTDADNTHGISVIFAPHSSF